ncbi:hypothetical protein K431DRAFT_282642 [Polychaeton citri CBS 116435]|uniref:Uncharacterized protein n=1 Tax=Polychaeton citri CBS 116435 TaxID=1314669 RepID=A0A9P4QB55_9PEZI|nr:hypothetical protein K431DRAFT_282642 [Polychaeton citri CBS 116435]
MALKRKRSSPSFSPPHSNSSSSDASSTTSSMPRWYHQSKPVDSLRQKPTWSFPTYEDSDPSSHLNATPSSHLGSRTRKRHRDDRPEEAAVYASTLNRLYEAQRKHLDAQAPVSHPPPPSSNSAMQQQHQYSHVTSPSSQQRSTLHSFWQLPASQPIAKSKGHDVMQIDSVMGSASSLESRCEGCDGALKGEDSMDVDDRVLDVDTQCQGCGRHVCDSCSITAEQRVCLGCASRL